MDGTDAECGIEEQKNRAANPVGVSTGARAEFFKHKTLHAVQPVQRVNSKNFKVLDVTHKRCALRSCTRLATRSFQKKILAEKFYKI